MRTLAVRLAAAIGTVSIALGQTNIAPLPNPRDLLDRAYRMSMFHPPQERTMTLYLLAQAAEPLSPKQARDWAIELFNVALQAGTRDADAHQKNALVILSRIDPVKAAELFRAQMLPKREAGVEDPRPYGAAVLFPALFQARGIKALDQIEMLAAWLGETGQYPYRGVAAILKSVADKDSGRARALWNQATFFFKDDPGFRSTEDFLADFLLSTYQIPAPAVLEKTLKEVVDWLEKKAAATAAAAGKKDATILEMRAGDKTFRFGSEIELEIYRLLPLIRQADPEWPSDVVKHHQAMSGLPEMAADAAYTTGGVIVRDPATTAADVQKALGQTRLYDVAAAAKTDPAAAMQMAENIESPIMRDLARADILPAYTAAGAQDGKAVLQDLAKKLDGMDPSVEKVRLEIAMARSYYGMPGEGDGDALLDRALSTGSAIFEEALLGDPGKITYSIKGFSELMQAAELQGWKSAKPWDALKETDQFQPEVMRPACLSSSRKDWKSAQRLLPRPHAQLNRATALWPLGPLTEGCSLRGTRGTLRA